MIRQDVLAYGDRISFFFLVLKDDIPGYPGISCFSHKFVLRLRDTICQDILAYRLHTSMVLSIPTKRAHISRERQEKKQQLNAQQQNLKNSAGNG